MEYGVWEPLYTPSDVSIRHARHSPLILPAFHDMSQHHVCSHIEYYTTGIHIELSPVRGVVCGGEWGMRES